ncbi:MAG TPA: mechanosensitive ion channel [Rhodospirillales bacterium]|nr:mechanosensitive ion channel [Rhodospirillales bacterium]
MDEKTLKLAEQLMDIGLVYALDILGAVAILIVGWIVAGWAGRLTKRTIHNIPKVDNTVGPIAAGFARYAVLAFVMVAVLAQFGIETTSILAVFGAAGLAIGLALQGTLSNIAAGMMLLLLRPFSVNEYIDADGISGTVEEIGLFTTRLTMSDGLAITAPNSSLWGSTIINYSRNPRRRISLTIGIAYSDDVNAAMAELLALMEADKRVLGDPAPAIFVADLADSSVNMTLMCWTASGDFWETKCDLLARAKLRLDEKGYSLPFPQRDVHLISET